MEKKTISGSIASFCLKKGVIETEDYEIYEYGIWLMLAMLANIATILFIGLVMGMIGSSLVFLIVYIPLRRYAGGYHAGSAIRCYADSVLCVILLFTAMRHFYFPMLWGVVIAVLLGISIVCLCPVEDYNKPLDQTQKKVYKKRAVVIYLLECLLYVVALKYRFYQVSDVIVGSSLLLCILLWSGVVKNRLIRRSA